MYIEQAQPEEIITHLRRLCNLGGIRPPQNGKEFVAFIQLGSSLVNEMHGVLNRPTGKTSQLNPRFVAEMMGYPPNWTELPFLNGETKASKDMATQLSHK